MYTNVVSANVLNKYVYTHFCIVVVVVTYQVYDLFWLGLHNADVSSDTNVGTVIP